MNDDSFRPVDIIGLEDYNPSQDEKEETYEPKSQYQKPLIVQKAVECCVEKRATEMKQGFWNTKLDKQMNPIKTWEADQRKVYIGAVLSLKKLLSSECREDLKFKDAYKLIEAKIETLLKKYSYYEYEYYPEVNSWKRNGERYLPQIDDEVMVPSIKNKNLLTLIRGGWNQKINALYDQLVPLYDDLFEELNMVIARKNNFAQVTSY